MQALVGILVVIAVTLIAGPVVGGLVLLAVMLLLIPGFGMFLSAVVLFLAFAVADFPEMPRATTPELLIIVVGIMCLAAIVFTWGQSKKVMPVILDRQLIEGTDIYQDQHGGKWRKIAGIYKPFTDDTAQPSS